MARLTAADRKRVPKAQMGLPAKATKKGGAVTGSYPMPDKAHAIAAKAFATRFATPAQRSMIDAKANDILGKTLHKKVSTAVKKGRAKP
jgi:hypothetical protein